MSKIPVGYSLNDCPPIKETVPLSIQQIVVLVFNVLPVPLLIGAGIGLSASEITILVAGCLLVTGIATLLQTIGVGPIGARLPIPLECSFVFVAPGIALGAQYGLAAFTGACLVGSIITTILWTGLHKQLSILFKPYITGAVVMALGLSLCSVGIGYCAGGVGSADYGDPINLLLAAGTIIIMVLLNYFCSKNFLSKASPLIAILVMSAAAAAFGKLDLSPIGEEAWIRIPQPLHFGIKFELGPIISISILCFIALVELMGDQTTASMLAKNSLPTSHETKGGVLAQGVGSVISYVQYGSRHQRQRQYRSVRSFRCYQPLCHCHRRRCSRSLRSLPQTVRRVLLHSLRCSGRRGPLRFRHHSGFRHECYP